MAKRPVIFKCQDNGQQERKIVDEIFKQVNVEDPLLKYCDINNVLFSNVVNYENDMKDFIKKKMIVTA